LIAGNLADDQLWFCMKRVTLDASRDVSRLEADRSPADRACSTRDYSRVNSRNDRISLVCDETAIPERTACLSARTATRVRMRFVAGPRLSPGETSGVSQTNLTPVHPVTKGSSASR